MIEAAVIVEKIQDAYLAVLFAVKNFQIYRSVSVKHVGGDSRNPMSPAGSNGIVISPTTEPQTKRPCCNSL